MTMETPTDPALTPVDYTRPEMMAFWDALEVCFRKYASFSGRAQRSEYWWWWLFTTLGTALFGSLGPEIYPSQAWAWLLFAWTLAVFIPSLAVLFRRLHDTNTSGWFGLVVLIPLLGWIFLIVVLATQGSQRLNRYGPAPGTEPEHETPNRTEEAVAPRPAPPHGVEERLRAEVNRSHDRLAELPGDAFSKRMELREMQHELTRQLAEFYGHDLARIKAVWDAQAASIRPGATGDTSDVPPSPPTPTSATDLPAHIGTYGAVRSIDQTFLRLI